MIGEVPRQVPDNSAYEVIMKMLGLWVGAYYMIDARREFTLV